MELLWRLDRPLEALAVTDQIDQFNSSSATEYQLALLSELGWRYRKPELVYAAAPYLDQLDRDRYPKDYDRRLAAIHLALDKNIYPHYERFLDADGDLIKVREHPEYWLTVAAHYNKKADSVAALETYHNALEIFPDNTDALSGLIWTMLGEDTDSHTITATLDKYADKATEVPALWNPYAVGYLRAKQPETSLRWFSKIMAQNDHDYNVLLSFADALEQTGNDTHAYKVRAYAVQQLQPQIMASATGKIDALGRDYISVLRSHGSAAENEAWTQKLVTGIDDSSPKESAWRRELAASWYLATQRREILASSKSKLSTGDELLALRKLGREREAYVLANKTLETSLTNSERNVAREHILSIRGSRPSYYSALVMQRQIGRLDITESALSLRHTLTAADIGFEVDYQRNSLNSNSTNIAGINEDDLAVSAHFGNSRRGGRVTTGVNYNGDEEVTYASGRIYLRNPDAKREIISEVGFNEIPDISPEFRLGATRNKAEISLQTGFGNNEFVKLSGKVNELTDRIRDERIALGAGGAIEIGSTGSVGSNSWTVGLSASGEVNDREPASNLSSLLFEDSQQVSFSAALFRGGIRSDYPSTASPRYRVAARVGHSWPTNSTAFGIDAGAGFRVLGNDELSLQIAHDRQAQEVLSGQQSNSTVGVQYINHF